MTHGHHGAAGRDDQDARDGAAEQGMAPHRLDTPSH
jgi:hypothetical protein